MGKERYIAVDNDSPDPDIDVSGPDLDTNSSAVENASLVGAVHTLQYDSRY